MLHNCTKCFDTGYVLEDYPEAGGFVEEPCENCTGGRLPDEIAEIHDQIAQAEIDEQGYSLGRHIADAQEAALMQADRIAAAKAATGDKEAPF